MRVGDSADTLERSELLSLSNIMLGMESILGLPTSMVEL